MKRLAFALMTALTGCGSQPPCVVDCATSFLIVGEIGLVIAFAFVSSRTIARARKRRTEDA